MKTNEMADVEIEPSVQMRLYTLNKRHFVVVFLAFLICFSITIFIGLAGPDVMNFNEQNSSSLILPPTDLTSGPYILKSPPVTTFHQQLWLTMRTHIDMDIMKSGMVERPFNISVQVRGLVTDDDDDDIRSDDSLLKSSSLNHSRTLHCVDEVCEDIILLHLSYLAYPHYIITVHVYGLQSIVMDHISFQFTYYNSSFTQLEIWLRFTFLLMAFIATCWFAYSLRKFAYNDWSFEQKWMTLLLPLLLLYDNPVFPLTFLVNSWIPGMLDTIFQASFLTSLLLYWLCIYDGVRQGRRRLVRFYIPKIVLVGSLWLLVVSLSSWQELKQLYDPIYDYQFDTGYATMVKIMFAVVAIIYLFYLIYLLVRAYAELRSMPYFDLRLKFMTVLMLIVLVVTITIASLRFGINPLFADHFVPELSSHYHTSAMFAGFFGLLNFYLFTMAFVYSPSKNAVFESHFKDNPALSMLNDSEDDIVYSEETSLTRKLTNHRYDSDEEAFN